MNLEQRDWQFIGVLLFLWILTTFASSYFDIIQYGMAAELPFDVIAGLVSVAALYYIWQTIQVQDHEMGRALTLLGIGTGVFGLTLAPHIWLHMEMPRLFAVFGGFHVVTLWSFILITYGFYLLTAGWKE